MGVLGLFNFLLQRAEAKRYWSGTDFFLCSNIGNRGRPKISILLLSLLKYCSAVLKARKSLVFGFKKVFRFFKDFSVQIRPDAKFRPRKNISVTFASFSTNYNKTHKFI